MEFTEECEICMEKHVLLKKCLRMGWIVFRPRQAHNASTPEMVDSINAVILADRKVINKDIPEQLENSVGTTHKIVYDDFCFF